MTVSFVLKESVYDCMIKITDSHGEQCYYIPCLQEEGANSSSIMVEIFDYEFDLTLTPAMPNMSPLINEFEEKNWKDKLAKKASKLLCDAFEKTILRVGCCYHIDEIKDGDCIDITLQTYVFRTFDRYDLLEIYPVMYMFFEVFRDEKRLNLTTAFETNRKEVLKAARGITLASAFGVDFFLTLILVYPIQISRVKRLTKNKKIAKTLKKFHNLSNAKRLEFLDKQEKFIDRYAD